MRVFVLPIVLVLACGGGHAVEPAPLPPHDPAPAPVAPRVVAPVATVADAGIMVPSPPPPLPPPPAPVARSGKLWPYHAWDRAEAVTFNDMPAAPGVQLLAFDDRGPSPNIKDKKTLTPEQAKKAASYVVSTEGGVEVSKCPFPRHAVIFYDHDVAVASANVCFECGDILTWPRWDNEKNFGELTEKEQKASRARAEKQMPLYKKTFPKWKDFFRDELRFSIEPPPRP